MVPVNIRTAAEQFLTMHIEERQSLLRLVMEGHLRPDDDIRESDQTQWQRADSLSGLFPDDLNEDIHGSREYRANLVNVLTKRAVARIAGR